MCLYIYVREFYESVISLEKGHAFWPLDAVSKWRNRSFLLLSSFSSPYTFLGSRDSWTSCLLSRLTDFFYFSFIFFFPFYSFFSFLFFLLFFFSLLFYFSSSPRSYDCDICTYIKFLHISKHVFGATWKLRILFSVNFLFSYTLYIINRLHKDLRIIICFLLFFKIAL